MVIKTRKANGTVNIKVDERFFNQFENKKNEITKKLGLRTISQKDFTKMLAEKKIFNNFKLLKNENVKRKKR